MIRSVLTLFLVFLFFPFMLGKLSTVKNRIGQYLTGYAAMQAVFFLVYVIVSFLDDSLVTAGILYLILLCALSAFQIFREVRGGRRKNLRVVSHEDMGAPSGIRGFAHRLIRKEGREAGRFGDAAIRYLTNIWFLLALVLILYQIFRNITTEPAIYGDDSFYIQYVTKMAADRSFEPYGLMNAGLSYGVNYKHILTSYYKWLSFVSMFTGVHPLVLCKTLLAVLHLALVYLSAWRIGAYLFSDQKNPVMGRSLYLLFYTILIEWGYISYYTFSRRALLWVWNSKSLAFCIFLPYLALMTYVLLVRKEKMTEIVTEKRSSLWKALLILTLTIACGSATLMGVLLSAILLVFYFAILLVQNRSLRSVLPMVPALAFDGIILLLTLLNVKNMIMFY
ncbi:MAG: DUF6077 domain-containing protein [Eubacterium sp.]|nr:DUF6077 domain-containing protein [Eubacterium sp.]